MADIEAVVQNQAYPGYSEELATVPAEQDLRDHLNMLNVLSREAGERVKHHDGRLFRQSVFNLVDDLGDLLSKVAESYEVGDASGFHNAAGLMGGKIAELSALSEEGIADLSEVDRFFKSTVEVCKRVEKMEELKTGRLGVMKESEIMRFLDGIPRVLEKYLAPERARQAWKDLLEGYRFGGK